MCGLFSIAGGLEGGDALLEVVPSLCRISVQPEGLGQPAEDLGPRIADEGESQL